MTLEDFGRERAAELENAIKQLGADRVAAFIAEPVQGAGGGSWHLTPTGPRCSASAIITVFC